MSVDPNVHDLLQFLREDDGGPVVMLNLVNFCEGGEELYREYVDALRCHVNEFGGQLIYFGRGSTMLVGSDSCDAVMMMEYPSRRAFINMLRDRRFRSAATIRSQSLRAATLQATTQYPSNTPNASYGSRSDVT